MGFLNEILGKRSITITFRVSYDDLQKLEQGKEIIIKIKKILFKLKKS